MALIECPECGRKVSDQAASCPQCGCPLGRAAVHKRPPVPRSESELYSAHPAMFRGEPGRTLCIIVLVVLCFLTFFGVFDSLLGEDGALFGKVLGVFALLAIPPYLVLWWIRCKAAKLIITTDRITARRGILSKKTTEVRHVDVRFVQVEQSILQRMLAVGGVAVGTAGHAGLEIQFGGLRNPERVAAMIRERQGG